MIIGLTGGIGSGKTLATNYLKSKLGLEILDADIVAREVVAKGSPLLAIIATHFGSDALTQTGDLNRPWLRQVIFNTPEEKNWLESVTHPEIRARCIEKIKQTDRDDLLVLVSPLLFEASQDELCDKTITISATPELQRQRTLQRDGSSPETIESILTQQWSDCQRESRADFILYNKGDPKTLYLQLDELITPWIRKK